MNEFETRLKEKIKETDAVIGKYLPEETGYQKTVFQAMNYSVKAGGKRLRPLIMQEIYQLCGGTEKDAIEPFMAALELIHTYSLVHDDLPAMDDDDYRRGKLTTHKKFGEAMGILAGDALLNAAYETAALAFDGKAAPQTVAKALQVLAKKAGVYGMVGGQVVDVENNGKFLDEEMLLFVYETKTSALLEAAFMIGGILAGASETDIQKLEMMGKNLGIAFQIQDDILDVIGDEQKLGKPLHSDEKNEKSTYVAAHGIAGAEQKVKEYTEKALQILQEIQSTDYVSVDYVSVDDTSDDFLRELMIWLTKREQ
jgi:geranylgeranyl diphosphate synthase type II